MCCLDLEELRNIPVKKRTGEETKRYKQLMNSKRNESMSVDKMENEKKKESLRKARENQSKEKKKESDEKKQGKKEPSKGKSK